MLTIIFIVVLSWVVWKMLILGVILPGIYASNAVGKVFDEMKQTLSDIVQEYPEILQMQGFYVDTEKKLVYFDLIIDFKAENKEKIANDVAVRMKAQFGEYEFIVALDSDVSG